MNIKHNLSKHPLFQVWSQMKKRCLNKKDRDYPKYGGRGIIVCEKWKNSFIKFYEWAISNEWERGLYIDRINNDGDYRPDNCRFVTRLQNILNTKVNPQNNKTGLRGVYKRERGCHEKYEVYIMHRKVSKYLGIFDSPRLAALRYDAEAYLLNDGRPRNFF